MVWNSKKRFAHRCGVRKSLHAESLCQFGRAPRAKNVPLSKTGILVRHQADLDALGYFEFLNERNPESALNFLETVDQTVDGLALQPLKGRIRRFRGKGGKDLQNIRS